MLEAWAILWIHGGYSVLDIRKCMYIKKNQCTYKYLWINVHLDSVKRYQCTCVQLAFVPLLHLLAIKQNIKSYLLSSEIHDKDTTKRVERHLKFPKIANAESCESEPGFRPMRCTWCSTPERHILDPVPTLLCATNNPTQFSTRLRLPCSSCSLSLLRSALFQKSNRSHSRRRVWLRGIVDSRFQFGPTRHQRHKESSKKMQKLSYEKITNLGRLETNVKRHLILLSCVNRFHSTLD